MTYYVEAFNRLKIYAIYTVEISYGGRITINECCVMVSLRPNNNGYETGFIVGEISNMSDRIASSLIEAEHLLIKKVLDMSK